MAAVAGLTLLTSPTDTALRSSYATPMCCPQATPRLASEALMHIPSKAKGAIRLPAGPGSQPRKENAPGHETCLRAVVCHELGHVMGFEKDWYRIWRYGPNWVAIQFSASPGICGRVWRRDRRRRGDRCCGRCGQRMRRGTDRAVRERLAGRGLWSCRRGPRVSVGGAAQPARVHESSVTRGQAGGAAAVRLVPDG